MGKSAIMLVIGSLLLFVVMNLIINNRLTTSTETSVEYFSEIKARNISNTMAEMLLAELADDNDFRVITPQTRELFGGEVTYTVIEVGAVGDAGGEITGNFNIPTELSKGINIQYASVFNISESMDLLRESLNLNETDDSESEVDIDYEIDTDVEFELDYESTYIFFTDHDDHDDHSDFPYYDRTIIKLSVLGTYDEKQKYTTVYAALPEKGYVPDATMAGISANSPVSTNGNFIIDGRNHDINGVLIDDAGTEGLWTTSSFTQGGSSKVGGTDDGSDIEPYSSADTTVFKTGQSYFGGVYPSTPDEVLGGASEGFTGGVAKTMAISGDNGGQYVTDPSFLTFPLSGITYVELPSGTEWNPANIQGSGVLIVHNATVDAKVKNVNSSPFTGLFIVDDIMHIHADIIGALVCLSPTPSEGNVLGNGNGSVLYSSAAVMNATYSATGKESDPEYGMGRHRLLILAWNE